MIEDSPVNGREIQRRYGTIAVALRGPWTARCIDADSYTIDTHRIEAWALNIGIDADPGPVAIGVYRPPEVAPGSGFGDTLFSVAVDTMTPREVVATWWRAVAIAEALNLNQSY